MRTSKKILSFFLAVVMVATSCSVGITAFAQTNNPSIWSTENEAEDAFASLDNLANRLPKILMENVPDIANMVYEKYAKADGKDVTALTDEEKKAIDNSATLQDILGALQPTVLGVDLFGQNMSVAEFIDFYETPAVSGWNGAKSQESDYSWFVQDEEGKLSLPTIMAICYNFKDDSSLSSDAQDQLTDWYNDLDTVLKAYLQWRLDRQAEAEKLENIAARINENVPAQPGNEDYSNTYLSATLYDLENFNFGLNSEETAYVDEQISNYQAMYTAKGYTDVKIDSLATLIYYTMGAGRNLDRQNYVRITNAINDGGNTVDYNGTDDLFNIGKNASTVYDITDIKEGNYTDKIIGAVTSAEGMTEREIVEAMAGNAALEGKTLAELSAEKDALEQDIIDQTAASEAARSTILSKVAQWFTAARRNQARTAVNSNDYATIKSWPDSYYNAATKAAAKAQVNAWVTAEETIIADQNELAAIEQKLADYSTALVPVNNMNDAQIRSYLEALCVNIFGQKILLGIGEGGVNNLQNSDNYYNTLLGVAKKYANMSESDVESAASALMPSGSTTVNLSASEIQDIAKAFSEAASDLPSEYWTNGSAEFNGNTYTCPSSIVGTAVADYFKLINANTSSDTNDHRMGLYAAFQSANTSSIQSYYDEAYRFAKTKAVMNAVDFSSYVTYDATLLLERMDIIAFLDEKFVEEMGGGSTVDDKFIPTDEQKALLNQNFDFTGSVGSEVTNEALNRVIPPLLQKDIGIGTIEGIISMFMETNVDLIVATTDVWERLYNAPVKTVFELLPVLLTVVNEVLEPLVFNNNSEDALYKALSASLLDGKSDLLKLKLGIESGSYIGISRLHWDLNVLLPELMDWLINQTTPSQGYYNQGTVTVKSYDSLENIYVTQTFTADTLNSKDPIHYVVTDQDGNRITTYTEKIGEDEEIRYYTYMGSSDTDLKKLINEQKPDAEFTETFTYESNVPVLTGIYIADKALRDADVNDLKSILAEKLTEGIMEDNTLTSEEKQQKYQTRYAVGQGLGEIICELATLFDASLHEFVNDPALASQAKVVSTDSSSLLPTESYGLNNLMVAIPELFDIMENLAADKYGVDRDAWTYCYDGKAYDDVDILDNQGYTGGRVFENSNGYWRNAAVEAFKEQGASTDPDRAVKILDIFAGVFVNDWLNAIFSLLDETISGNNQITASLPIVTGLLNALGGFGEESVITDVFNGIFQIEREDPDSFTFETDEIRDYIGLDKTNAYFLLTNIDRLIEVIQNLIADFKGNGSDDDKDNDNNNSNNNTAGPVYVPKTAKNAAASSANYSASELENTQNLIDNLDEMLSSLLSDSTFNGYSLDEADNIAASLVTLLTNYLGNDCFTEIMKYLNCYSFNLTNKETDAPKNGDVNDKKVYSNESLTRFVVETYMLLEQIVEYYLKDFSSTYNLDDGSKAKYNLLVEAIEGVISPDSIALRLDDYPSAQRTIDKYNCWHDLAGIKSSTYLTRHHNEVKIDWGIKAGDKDAYFKALASSFRMITSILGVLLIDTNYYENIVMPILDAICTPNGIKVDTAAQYAKTTNGYHDEAILGLVKPISGLLNKFLDKPVTTLIKTVQGLAGILDDTQGATIASIVNNAVTPIVNELSGAANILMISTNVLNPASPTLADVVTNLTQTKIAPYADTSNIKLGKGDYKYPLSGNNLVPIINSYIANTGITLQKIDWKKLNKAPSTAAALVYILEYVLDVLLENDNLVAIIGLVDKDGKGGTVVDVINAIKDQKINPKDILKLLNQILEATDSPTLAYWTFVQYLQEASYNFVYPKGVTKQMADEAVESLDQLVENIFPLLSTFGVDLGGDTLKGVLNSKAFTNDNVTAIAKALYGALDGLDPTVKAVINGLGIPTSTDDVAALLTDSSYGATYSSAAKAISATSIWSHVDGVNWGFTDGSDKAQQGFVNALAAVLRPINDVLAVFLNEGSIKIDDTLYGLICGIDVPKTVKYVPLTKTEKDANGKEKKVTYANIRLTYAMSDGVFVLNVREDPKVRDRSRSSQLRIDFKALRNYDDLQIQGTNGYNSAIIPLLEALQCDNVVSYSQYQKDVANAKDNLLLDILNPIAGDNSGSLLNKLCDAPFTTLLNVLPNVALYMDAHGLSQAINNLLAPVTGLVAKVNDVIDINELVGAILGTDLGSYLGNLLGVGKINIDFNDLSSINIEDYIIPIVNNLVFKNSSNEYLRDMRLADIDWEKLIALGDITSYTSAATGSDGYYLTGRHVTGIDEGKVLITVLRYLGNFLVDNAQSLKGLINSIDAVKNNALISSIVSSVFDTIGASSADEIIAALFYILAGEPQDAFWDYRGYKTGNYSFAYPETVDQDFLKQLPPMLDGLISGFLDLNGLIGEKLFTDELVAKAAKGIYGAVEKVKVGDNSLTSILAQTDIDFSTANVANLLVDKDYGVTYADAAATIRAAGSWANVNTDNLKFGVVDRDSFFHALVAVLRPMFGVLDVLLNDADLNLFDVVRLPGSNGYSSSIVPLMEAFSMYNIKTQYEYRKDIHEQYDAILLDIINPIWDLVEDVLNAPLQTIMAIVPNLALFIGNDGLCQVINNLITPVRAVLDSLAPIVDANELLTAVLDGLNVNLNSVLGKIGISNLKIDLYNIDKTLEPVLGGDAIVPLINNILGIIKIGDTSIDLRLNPIDWLQLASHGETVYSASQAATYGSRVFIIGDSSETLIAILRYLINTINTGENFDALSSLIGGLIGGANDSITDVVTQVLGMLQGDADEVISSLVELLQTLA